MGDQDADLIERFVITDTWWQMPEEYRQLWVSWGEHHGLERRLVLVPGWVERRPAERQVRYWGLRQDRAGIVWFEEGEWVVQLEARPTRFPSVADL